MRIYPSSIAEAIVSFWTPPSCREEVLGDLHERYRSPFQYAVEALHTIPAVVFSQIRRYVGPQLLLLQACTIYFSYLTAAWLIDGSLFQTEYGFLRLAIPAAGVLLIALLDTVYGNPNQSIRSKRPVILALSTAMCIVITVIPHPGHPLHYRVLCKAGLNSGVALSYTLCGLFLVIVDGDRLQIFRLEDLVTFETSDIVDPVTPGQYFRARVL